METTINPNSGIIKPWNIPENLPPQIEPESLDIQLPETFSDKIPENIKPEEMKGYINPDDIATESPDIGSEWLGDQIIEFIKSDKYKNLPPSQGTGIDPNNPVIKELQEKLGLIIE